MNNNNAIFGGTADTISVDVPIIFNDLTFSISGYVISNAGAGSLTLGNDQASTITVTNGGDIATIAETLANSANGPSTLTKAGAGTLILTDTANSFSGGLIIGAGAGTLQATTNNGTNVTALGAGAVSIGTGSTVNLLSANTLGTATTINSTFTGSGLLKLTFTDTTATNTNMNGLSGFAGTIQLANTGVNGDKLNTNNNMGNIAGLLIVDNGSQLFVTGTSTTNFAGGISITGTGNSENRGVIRLGAGVLGGNISLAGSSTIGLEGGYLAGNISAGVAGTQTLTFGGAPTGNGTLSGNISDGFGTVALTKSNTGALWLTGTNTYTGATTISASGGRLQLGLGGTTGSLSPSSPISVGTGASLTFNRSNAMADGVDFGAISGAGNVTQNGTGTTTFGTATAQAYTGQTQVNRGSLVLSFENLATPTNMISAASVLNLGGGTLSVLGKSTGTTAQTFASTTLSAGRAVIAPNRGAGTSTTLNLGVVTRALGNSITFQPNTPWAAGGSATTAGAASTTEIVNITSVAGSGGTVALPGAGFSYIGANVFYGVAGSSPRYAVVLPSGQIVGGPTGTTFVTTGGAASTVYSFVPAGTTALTGPLTTYAILGNGGSSTPTLSLPSFNLTTNGYLGVNTVGQTISATGTGSIVIGAQNEFVVNLSTSGGLTISAPITGATGAVTNASSSTGALTLSGANTYAGGTFFNGGTTVITTDGAASAAAQLGTVPAAATAGNLTFNGGTLQLAPTAAVVINANRGIALGASGGTINLTTAQQATVSSIIAGIGGLTLNNSSTSTLSLGGVNTYTGTTFINGTGVIVPANVASPFGVGGILTLNGGQMRATVNGNVTIANPVTITANTTFPTTATEKSLIFTGLTVLSGTRTLNSGVGATVAGTSVQFSNGITESTALSGLTKAGTGNLILGGLNTFTGPTTISAGRLAYTKTFALYANNPASWTDTNITVANAATMMLSVGGTNEFTSANVATIAALGTATGGFQSGSTLGLDTTGGSFTPSAAIVNPNGGANAINLLKIGANNLTLNGTNTYTGTTTIQGGTVFANGSSTTSQININGGTNTTLQVTNPSATGTGSINIATGATTPSLLFRLDGGGNIPLSNSLIGNSGITTTIDVNNNGTGTNGVVQLNGIPATGIGNVTLNITGGNGYSLYVASIFSSGGANGTTLVNPTTASVTFGNISSITNTAAYNWQFDGTATGNAVTGAITNGSGTISVTKANTSIWTLSGNNTYTGATTVSAGTLILSGTNTGTGATNVVGGILQATANGALNPNSAVTMTDAAAAVLDLNGNTGTIASLAGGGAVGGNVTLGSGTLTTGDATSTSYSGNISGTGGNLIKNGLGAFTLAGTANSYTGTTLVNAGTLIVNSTLASLATTVTSTSTLGGIGTLANSVVINSGATLSPATSTSGGTITMGSLTLDAGSQLAFEFGGTPDLVNVSAASGLTINGGAISLYATGGVAPLTTNGTYTLFNYTTAFGGLLTNLSVANSQAGKTYVVNDAIGSITLTVGTATTSDWSGTLGNGLWTSDGVGGNWNGGTAPNSFGAVANFGALAGAPTTVTLNGGKTVGNILFDNANAFTIGTTADTITLDNGIAAGAISVTTGSHTINAPIALNGPANITPAATTSITFGGAISGTGKTLTFSGAGASTLSAVNNYTGGTTLSAGTLNLGNDAALGSGLFTIAGGILDATGGARTLSGNNAVLVTGNFTFTGTNDLNIGTGAVSIPVSGTLTANAGTLTVGGVISGAGLNKAGAGTLALTGNNIFTGALTIAASGGTVILSGNNSARPAGTNGLTTINSGAILELQANAGNTTAGISTALSGERTANQPLVLNTGGTLQLRSDSAVTFAGANSFGGLGSATVAIDVNQLSTGANNVITLAPGGFNVSATTINVTGGNGYTLRLPAISSIGANTSTYNGNSAPISIGNYTATVTGAHVLGLGGTNTGNLVTGIVSNGSGTTVGVTKTGTGTWELSGASTYTGTTNVTDGTLILSGRGTGTPGTISVSTVAGLSATLNITAGTYALGAGQMNVGNAATTAATGTVFQTGGAISFTSGNALLVGQNSVANQGIYNLSGGSITTFASTTRGIMLGVNDGALGGTFNLSGTGVLNMTAASGGGGDAVLMIGRYEGTAPGAPNTTNLFKQTGGIANVGILSIGGLTTIGIGINSTLTLTGGTFVANQFARLAAGNTNTAAINIGGTAAVTLPAFPTARGTSSAATITFDSTTGFLSPLVLSTTYMPAGTFSNAYLTANGAKFDVGTGKDITIAQAFQDAVSPAAVGTLTKSGNGTLTLSGANTYTGLTSLNVGSINVGNISALGTTDAGTTVASGARVTFTALTTGSTVAEDFNIAGTGIAVDGVLNMGGNKTVNLSGAITLAADVLLKADGGSALNFTGASGITGTNTNLTFQTDGSVASSITGPISLGTGSLTKTGGATLALSGSNTYTGKTTVSAGGLTFNTIGDVAAGASALGAPTTVAEGTIDLSGTLTYTGAANSTNRVINLTNGAANSTINNSGIGLLTWNGDITGGALALVFRGAGNIAMNGLIPATQTGTVTHTESSTLTLTNALNAWTGSLNISKGVVSVASIANKSLVSAIGAGTLITLGQSGFNNTGTLQFTGASGGSSDRDIDIQSNAANANGGIIENTVASQLLTLSGNVTVGGTGTLPALGLSGAGNGLLSGNILGTPALAVTKTGTGTWTLTGVNTHTRGTTVDGGAVNVNADAALGDAAGAVAINNGATLQAGGTLTTAARTVTLGTGGGTIDTNGNIVNLNAGSTVTGTTLTKTGTGTLNLAGTQTYSTLITSVGTTNANSAIGTGTSTVNANATTNFGVSQTLAALNIGTVPFAESAPMAGFAGDGSVTSAVVPEPGSLGLLAVGALGFLGRRRRQAAR